MKHCFQEKVQKWEGRPVSYVFKGCALQAFKPFSYLDHFLYS